MHFCCTQRAMIFGDALRAHTQDSKWVKCDDASEGPCSKDCDSSDSRAGAAWQDTAFGKAAPFRFWISYLALGICSKALWTNP